VEQELPRCTRQCAATDRELAPGEEFYSVLKAEGANLVRQDYSKEAWHGPPEGVIGWWKSQIPLPDAKRVQWAPNDVMLDYFERLDGQPDQLDTRYILALLLVRRRVLRLDDEECDEQGRRLLVLYSPRRDATFRTCVVALEESRVNAIQDELARLLFSRAA
jgi:hypothetical protein